MGRGPGRPRTAGVDDRVLAAATALLAEHGPGATTLERVARAAGVSRPSIYRRWPSKEALAREAVRRALPDPPRFAAPTGDARADLERFVAGALALPQDAPTAEARALVRRPELAPLVAAAQVELLTAARDALARIVAAGVDAGRVRADVDVDLLGDVVAAHVVRVVTGGAPDPAGSARALVALLWSGIGAPGR